MCDGCETPLLEPYVVPEVYVDGIADIQDLGSCFRTIYYTWVRLEDGRMHRAVAAKVVRPKEAVEHDRPFWRRFWNRHHSLPAGASSQESAGTRPPENVLMLSTASQSGRTNPRR